MPDDTTLIIDLEREALSNICYLSWIAAGGLVGSLSMNPYGTLIGAAGGLAGAVLTCGWISGKVGRYMKRNEFDAYHGNLKRHSDISREEAMALLLIARLTESQISAAPMTRMGPTLERTLGIMRS